MIDVKLKQIKSFIFILFNLNNSRDKKGSKFSLI